MKQIGIRRSADYRGELTARQSSHGRLLIEYSLLFALFFILVFSPFWFYGKAFLWSSDGTSQHLSELFFLKRWVRAVARNLRVGKWEIPFWDLSVGFGQSTLGNIIGYRMAYNIYALLPDSALEAYLFVRVVLYLYFSGLSFMTYAGTRTRDRQSLLFGSLLYAFSGFMLYFSVRHFFFLDFAVGTPLLLLSVDQIFERKKSWLFIALIAIASLRGIYVMFMMTIPPVIYAVFHYFELSVDERANCGGFFRILLRHVVHYVVAMGLAAIVIVPSLVQLFSSARTSAQKGVSPWHWNANVYLNFVRAIVDPEAISIQGYIAMPGIAFIGIFYLIYSGRKRYRLVLGQLLLYAVVFLVPFLTMLFSGLAGRTQRWCFIYSLLTSMAAALALPGLLEDDGRGHRFCLCAFLAYAALYMAVSIWTDKEVSISLLAAMISAVLLLAVVYPKWGRRRKGLAVGWTVALLLVEMTVKSYVLYSPQYQNYISQHIDAGRVLGVATDNASDALEMAGDDGLFRTEVLALPRSAKDLQGNYGARNNVNGISSYFSYIDARMANYSRDLGNAWQKTAFKIMDLDQRTVLNELAAVKYLATLENGLSRIPYGYEEVGSRPKTLSNGAEDTEHLFRNQYALPLSYAYDAWISREDYEALPINRREQSMLQGVVMDSELPLKRAETTFDDVVILENDAFMEAFAKNAAQKSDKLELTDDGTLRVKANSHTVSIPIEETEGEIYLLLENVRYESVNYSREKVQRLIGEGASRTEIANEQRKARTWKPSASSTITVTSGELSDNVLLDGGDAQYYMGPRDILLNLGYGATAKQLKITFSTAGEFRFDRMALIAQPMDSYAKRVQPLLDRQALSTEIDGNDVTVKYDLDESAFACLAIPYSVSWSATVDGEKAELLPANGMYMGVMLTPGPHTVVFRNQMLGFREGAIVSLASLVGLIVFAIVSRRRRSRPAD